MRWQKQLATGDINKGKGNMASPSPVTDGKTVYALFGTGDLAALDFDGNIKWQRNLGTDYGRFAIMWLYGSSPLLFDGKLYVQVLQRTPAPPDYPGLAGGDNSRQDYDEPTWMRDAFIAHGVPTSAITLDYAGFRTLDTMARARAVFGLMRATIVTDDFHQPRALFLAGTHGFDAVGFPSEHVPDAWSKITRTREIGSRVKACLDVYVLRKKPKFYGPPVTINLAAR